MSEFQETYRVPVTVTLSDGTSVEGEIHLQTGSALHEGGETAVEMLNRPERFFAVSFPSGDVALLCKAQVAVVTCEADLWQADPERLLISKKFLLDVSVIGGKRICGSAYWELPSTHPRPQDFLNSPETFFEITEEGNVHCVNRTLVTLVNPLD